MTQKDLAAALKSDTPYGIFLFCGEEDYLKRHYVSAFREKILADPATAPFSHFVFEGAKVDGDALLEAAGTTSLFSEGKLIEWQGVDFEQMKESEIKAFEALCEKLREEPEVAVIFCASPEGLLVGTEKRPTKLFTRLEKALSAVPFYHATDASLLGWIRRHLAAEGLSYEEDLPSLLLSHVGHSMDMLSNEIDKLAAYAKALAISRVGEREVMAVCIKTVESDAFSFTNALLDGKMEKAYLYLGDMKRRRVDPIAILGQISRLYSDLLSVAILSEEGKNEKEIAKELSMHEYKAGLYFRSAKRLGLKKVEELLAMCVKIDGDLKRGSASYRGLELLLASQLG